MKIMGAFLFILQSKVLWSSSSALRGQLALCHNCKPGLCVARVGSLSYKPLIFSVFFSVLCNYQVKIRARTPPLPLEQWEYLWHEGVYCVRWPLLSRGPVREVRVAKAGTAAPIHQKVTAAPAVSHASDLPSWAWFSGVFIMPHPTHIALLLKPAWLWHVMNYLLFLTRMGNLHTKYHHGANFYCWIKSLRNYFLMEMIMKL